MSSNTALLRLLPGTLAACALLATLGAGPARADDAIPGQPVAQASPQADCQAQAQANGLSGDKAEAFIKDCLNQRKATNGGS